ncbi:MAG: Panacea domain-containing protein [Verrucomicrobiota bacterium]
MNLPFNERKATQAAARLLKLRGSSMSYLKLIKLLYLADREALLRWGRSITTDQYVSMRHGPVLSHVLNLVTEEDSPGDPSIWAQHVSEPEHYSVRLQSDPGEDELSTAEMQLLDEIFKKYGAKTRWNLVDITHQLPEWKDPQGSAIPISYRDILKAGGKKESEITAIEDELEEVALMENLLGAH